ncbi:MAG: hypothetical protein ABI619_01875 [Betaproteobacteria bacterium]
MNLMKQQGVRVILVEASVADWGQETPMLSTMAMVDVNGQWPGVGGKQCGMRAAPPDRFE